MSYNGGGRLSVVSIGSMADLGYQVDYKAADPFPKSKFGGSCVCNRRLRGSDGNTTFLDLMEEQEEEAPAPRRRELSETGRQEAQAFGAALLQKRKEFGAASAQTLTSSHTPSVDYVDVGSKVVMILYEEEGVVYSIRVHN